MNILDRMEHYHVPGVSAAVINKGKLEWAQAHGVKEAGGNDPVTPETLFQVASGHQVNGDAVKGRWHVYPELAPAGLWTTSSDLCRFAIELQKSFAGESNKVISREMAGKMLAPGTGNWGLGIGLGTPATEERRSFSHGGGNKGYTCMLFAFVYKGQGAVVMTNSDNGSALVSEILSSLSSVYGWSILRPQEVALIEIVPEKLAPYVGDYRAADEPDMPVLVFIEKDQLHFKSSETGDWPLSPISETEFAYLDGGVNITFVKGSDGRYDQMKAMGQMLSRKELRSQSSR